MRISPALQLVVIIVPNHVVDEEAEQHEDDGVDKARI